MEDPMKSDKADAAGIQPVINASESVSRIEIFREDFADHKLDALMEGVILSEVLGLPLCRRKGRSIRR